MAAKSKIEVIRDFQGARSQNEFAKLLGLTSGGLSLILSGKRGADTALIRLLSLYPERASEINAALVLPDHSENLAVGVAD